MMNQGMKPSEIAEALQLPPSLEQVWSARGYYGTLSHDSRAVYQRYLGWYDGNPATLNPLTPEEGARKYVEYMGGSAAIIARARADFSAGQYRWVAQVMNQVVHAEPANQDARTLAADAFEQLGYLAESATWRNAYLLGAQELRNGVPAARTRAGIDADMLSALPAALVFDYLGTTSMRLEPGARSWSSTGGSPILARRSRPRSTTRRSPTWPGKLRPPRTRA
jgi:alkyl sulfatase BDS1-like metallo-beta-lactamase superfamily hydrolase